MNTETIDKVAELIEGLCEKLGTTAQYLIPEMAKMYIASGIFAVIMWGITALASGIIAIASYLKYKDDEFEVGYLVLAIIFMCVAVGAFIFTAALGESLVAWIASPTAKAIMTIMDKIK